MKTWVLGTGSKFGSLWWKEGRSRHCATLLPRDFNFFGRRARAKLFHMPSVQLCVHKFELNGLCLSLQMFFLCGTHWRQADNFNRKL